MNEAPHTLTATPNACHLPSRRSDDFSPVHNYVGFAFHYYQHQIGKLPPPPPRGQRQIFVRNSIKYRGVIAWNGLFSIESARNNLNQFMRLPSKFDVGKINYQKGIEAKYLLQVRARLQSFFTAKTLQIWRALFATRGL